MTLKLDGETERLLVEASRLFRTGLTSEAIVAYERLFLSESRLPDSWFNLAVLYRRANRTKDALAAYQSALDRGVSAAEEVHLNRGAILADNGDTAAAFVELEAALTLNPSYVPAWINLGNLKEDLGEFEAARAAYERAVALVPDNPMALARLVGLSKLDDPADPLLQRLFEASTRPGTPPLARADAGYALGAALDRIGAYDAAWEAYVAANRATRAVAALTSRPAYDRAAVTALVDRLIATFPAQIEPLVAEGDAPLFICGMLRSGSTLAEEILAQHSTLAGGGELEVLPALVLERLQPYPAAATTARLAELRDAYRAATAARTPAGKQLIDKQPDNVFNIGLIKALFPNARIVHTRRDRLDNCLSVYFLHAAADLSYATAVDDIAHQYAEQRRLMAHWHAVYPGDIFELDYDQLVADPQATVAPLLDFLDLAYEDGMIERRRTVRAVRTASHWQIRQPLYQSSSGRWRNYRQFLTGPERFAL